MPVVLAVTLAAALIACSPGDDPPSGASRESGAADHLVAAVVVEHAATTSSHERPGSLRHRRQVRLFSQEEGRITLLDVFEGDMVREGEVVVALEDDLLQAELDKARATLAQTELDVRRLEDLVSKRAASDAELSQARTAVAVAQGDVRILETRLAFTRIPAPFDGVVIERLVEPGDFVSKNTHLLTVADPESLVAEVYASELILPRMKVGDPAQLRIDALGAVAFPARILRIHPSLEQTSRQGIVELTLEDPPAGVKAGQFVRVTLETAAVERLLIPFRALRRDRDGELVWLVTDQGQASRRKVRSGLQMADSIEILEGLAPGDRIITRGFLGLSEDKTVKVVPE
ncbi:efflux RND transporter periplasmic adaptor subunit [Thiocapsa roseopersicina]|uniref:RND family efflux transporter, MFP subunit n=1 Tax=Thiocapsa roseopersicina TaxID=1058 RepID=A0A1H2QHH1_THIRO|nr:efflux RND transporter periplasmic adaptor subunit [Thiocapsa roseopersicina]SDW06074.1 RND family efflux transporter, MFP subunit [Thiocapsa roseopersicina]